MDSLPDFLTVCRTCIRPITDNNYSLVEQFMYDMIVASTGVMINCQDKLPHQICSTCLRTVHFAYSFRLECQKVDALLRKHLNEKEKNASGESERQCVNVEKQPEVFNFKSRNCSVRIKRNALPKNKTPEDNAQNISVLNDHSLIEERELVTDLPEAANERLEDEIISMDLPEVHNSKKKGLHFFFCTICSWKCETYRDIIGHYVVEHVQGDAPFQCPICSKQILKNKDLRDHIRSHINCTYICGICGLRFVDRFRYTRHMICHSSDRPHKCTHCGKTFKLKSTLNVHVRSHSFRKRLKRLSQARRFSIPRRDLITVKREQIVELDTESEQNEIRTVSTRIQLREQINTIKTSREPCVPRNNMIDTSGELSRIVNDLMEDEHITEGQPEFPINDDCYQKESDHFQTSKHEFIESSLQVLNEPLGVEHRIVKDLSNLNDSTSGIPHFSCTLCSWKFELYRDIIDHYLVSHSFETVPYQCPFCREILLNANALRKHLRTHVPQVYKCQYCGMQFAESFKLKRHLLSHTGERPYSCPHCIKKFQQKSGLNVHIQRHSGNKIFKCTKCPKEFYSYNGLRKHRIRYSHNIIN